LQTSRRDIFLLACCQALLLVNASGLISMNGLVGFTLAENKTLATFGATTYVLGSALATMPMSLWMGRVGRRAGFMAGAAVNIVGCVVAAIALQVRSFPLFCVATGIIGVYNAVGLQYRFAAAEVAAPQHRAMAISLVLAGGVVGGFIGPQSARVGRDFFATPFQGSFLMLVLFALVALAVQSQVHVPRPVHDTAAGKGRPLAEIARQPAFVVAVIAGALGYGLMNEPSHLARSTHEGVRIWEDASQGAVEAIRLQHDSHLVLVSGYGGASPVTWAVLQPRAWIEDPDHAVRYEAHQYFDAARSGGYALSYADETAAAAASGFGGCPAPTSSRAPARALGTSGVPASTVRILR